MITVHNPSRADIEARGDDAMTVLIMDFLQPWRAHAACRGADTELFHPKRGDKVRPVIEEYCNNCLVRVQCLEYQLSMTTPATDKGIWGGMSERQRRELRRAREEGREPEPHKDQAERRGDARQGRLAKGYCHACASAHHMRCIRIKGSPRPCDCEICYKREERLADPRQLVPSLTQQRTEVA